jgi:hypothetical protein
LIDNILSGDYVAPDPSRDAKLVGFIERVLEPQPFKRFRTVDALMSQLEMDREAC